MPATKILNFCYKTINRNGRDMRRAAPTFGGTVEKSLKVQIDRREHTPIFGVSTMPKSHKRQGRPIMPPAWTINSLCDALGMDRAIAYAAKRADELGPFYRIGVRKYVTTEDVIRWIKSHPKG